MKSLLGKTTLYLHGFLRAKPKFWICSFQHTGLKYQSMGISFWHLLILLVILIFVFGPSRLEGIGTSLGKAIRGFKKSLDGDNEDIKQVGSADDVEKKKLEAQKEKEPS
jgi:sec-independent protein translocase protein TatA